jgi:hypothetical protein
VVAIVVVVPVVEVVVELWLCQWVDIVVVVDELAVNWQ